MGFEQDALSELYAHMQGKRSKMQQEFIRRAHGEPFVLHELFHKGTMTPSQLAISLKASSGRVSAVLAALGKKGWITRDIDPDDRRIIRVNLTEAGREQARQDMEEMRSSVCWIFSQMGERRTREFVDLVGEFTTYMSIAHPGEPRPTPEEVRAAFAERAESAESAERAEPAERADRDASEALRVPEGSHKPEGPDGSHPSPISREADASVRPEESHPVTHQA
jgi:DNA-binding MarR family transcriptional regulator